MPCCPLCPHYKVCPEWGQARVDKECPGYISDDLPPKWFLAKTSAQCCPKCPYYKEKPEEKPWWCERPFAFELSPMTCYEPAVFSSRPINLSPDAAKPPAKSK